MAHNKSANLVITTRVNCSNETVNVDAVVNSSTFELNYGNNVDNDSLKVNPLCDLLVDIDVSGSPVNKEDIINWTVVVRNAGPDDASNVIVDLTDLNITDLIIINSSSNKFNNSSFKWIIGDLAHNKSANLVITTRVNCSNETLNIDAVVNSSTFELNRSNNIDNDSLKVNPLCDLIVDISVSRSPVNREDVVNWTVVVRNAGPDDASNVIVDLTDLKTTDLVLLNSSSNKFNNSTYKWTIGNLAHNKSTGLVITTKVNTSNETLNVDAVVNSSTFELNYANNVDNDSLAVNPLCDLIVDISVSGSPVNKEDIVNWTIVVMNNGPDDASNVVVDLTDLNINDLIIVNSSSNKFNNSTYKWIIGGLAHNKSVNLVITTKVNTSNETVNVDAVVNSSTFELNYGNNVDNDSLAVNPLCDLIVDIGVSRSPVNKEDVVNWTIVVRNAGPDDASNVVVDLTDLNINDLIIVNSSNNKFNNSTYKWTIGDLAHNRSVNLVITTRVNTSNETLNIGAVVNSSTFELNRSNNIDNGSLVVNPLCDLIVDINVSGSPVNKEDIVNWTIVVKNNGPDDASNVVVDLTDLNINDLIIVNSSSNKFNNSTYKWVIGDLAHNKSVYLVITTKVNTSNETVNVDAVVNSSTFELNYYNNIDNDSLAVNPLCDLIVDIDVSRSPVNKEDVVNWTIVVRNAGPDDASNVVVDLTDLNTGDLIILNSSNNKFNNSTFKWIVGDLAHNKSVNLIIITRVNTSNETIDVEAVANTTTFELNRTNNIDNDSLAVNPLCDILVDISIPNAIANAEDLINFTIIVKNDGPDDASNVSLHLTDLESLGLRIINVSDNGFNKSSYEWFIGDLANGGSSTLIVTTRVNCSNETLFVEAVANSSTYELNTKNNVDNVSLIVNPLCDLIVDINVSGSPVNKEDIVNWTVVVRNDGPDDANGVYVTLSDLRNLGLIILNSSSDMFNQASYRWFIGDLNHGESTGLIVTTKVYDSNRTITVQSVVDSDTFELNRTNNRDKDDLKINPLCDLAVDISVSSPTANMGDILNWTVVVRNDGPDDAAGVILNLSNLESLNLTILNVSDDMFNISSSIWNIGGLNHGDSVVLNIVTNVSTSNETLNVKASVDGDTYELNKANNVDEDYLIVYPACDLVIDISVSKNPANSEDIVDWTIVVRNDGPDDASKVMVNLSDLESMNLIITEVSSDNFFQNSYEWYVGDLVHGHSANLTISTKVDCSNVTIPVDTSVSSRTFELNMNNNFDNETLNVNPLCDLSVDISVSNGTANKEDIINWTIVIRNDGPDIAQNISLNISNLEDLGLIIKNSSNDTFNGSNWFIDSLSPGESVELVIVTQTNVSNVSIPVEVTVESDTYELNKENNADNESLYVNPLCDVAIEITVSNSTVNKGDTVEWTIVVYNNGPDIASDVRVSLADLEALGLIVLNVSYGSVESMDNASSANGNVLNASNSGASASGNGSGSLLSTGSSSGSLLSSSPSSGSLLSTGSALSTGSNTNPNDSSSVLSTRDLSLRGLSDLSEVNSSNQSNSANLSELNSSDSSSLLIQNSSVSVEEDSNSSDSDVNDFNNSDENNVSANVTAGSNSSDVNVSANVTAGSNSSDVNNSLDSKDDSSLKANTFDNATNGWYIGDLTNENTISLKLSTEVNKSNDNITVPATVNTSTYEIDKSNNFDDDLVKSRPVCDLEVNIFPNEDVFNVGDVVDWFVTVKNNGPDNASDVNVYNTLPKGLKFIGYDLDKGILENISGYSKSLKFRWNIGDLAVNESVVLVLSTKALKEGVIFNNVTVNSSTMDSDESNNYDFAFVEVIPLEEVPELENNTIDNKSNKTGNLDNDINNDVGGSVDSKAASIPMKKTGNPFAILVLIVFALFTLNFRRIRL
ncbi:MAG: DUF11 domain-containing protein [Methanobrevibacter sp.]|nr:DUF11 domain-containing protein [Methanobrevibacter sp.]